jgi:thiol-disulfide isomerase/thioredoxin
MNRNATLVAGCLLAIAAVAAGAFAFQLRTPARAEAPSPAAELFYRQSLADASGAVRAMADHRGKVVVVNFWATWCVPCVQEIPALSKANAEAAGRIAFVGLGIDSPSNIAAFVERFKPSYPLLAAGAGGTELARAFGNETGALPFTVVIGAHGQIVASHLGKVDDAMLRQWIAPYVTAPPSKSAGLRAGEPAS